MHFHKLNWGRTCSMNGQVLGNTIEERDLGVQVHSSMKVAWKINRVVKEHVCFHFLCHWVQELGHVPVHNPRDPQGYCLDWMAWVIRRGWEGWVYICSLKQRRLWSDVMEVYIITRHCRLVRFSKVGIDLKNKIHAWLIYVQVECDK